MGQFYELTRDRLNRLEAGQILVANQQKYQLMGKVGDGAIGVVRKARNLETQQEVVVKFLAPDSKYIDVSSLEDIYRRFKREGERGQHLRHDNLVRTIAFEENINGTNILSDDPKPRNPFIVMENGGNRTLEGYIRKDKGIPKGKFNFSEETIHIALQISRALMYLHRAGNVHRDVKPANIFMTKHTPPQVKLGDFGIVKWSDFKSSVSTGTLTTTGQSGLGTLKYMAPEQSLNPKDVGVQSDMYSFGITLYELFTNQILPDVHYVFLLREVRLERGNLENRLHKLGFGAFPQEIRGYEYLMELILDTTLKIGGRPTSAKFESLFRRLFSNVTE